MADAPAPLITTLTLSIDFLVISSALIKAAVVIIAVPCWSSWNTGISKISLSFSSIIKQSGAAMSSKLIPPNDGAKFLIELIISSVFFEVYFKINRIYISKSFKQTALPSITGFDASAPKLPKPRIAEPLLITATKLPLLV